MGGERQLARKARAADRQLCGAKGAVDVNGVYFADSSASRGKLRIGFDCILKERIFSRASLMRS
jgi:hypothetical protein